MTLTEFLLARIAEDEQDSWVMSEGGGRMRDECEAKRRIVERYLDERLGGPGPLVAAHEYDLQMLTLPYAAHPDCRREWRP